METMGVETPDNRWDKFQYIVAFSHHYARIDRRLRDNHVQVDKNGVRLQGRPPDTGHSQNPGTYQYLLSYDMPSRRSRCRVDPGDTPFDTRAPSPNTEHIHSEPT